MSAFASKVKSAFGFILSEFGDTYIYRPMKQPPNSEPVPDGSRIGGSVFVAIIQPSKMLGSSWGLMGSMMQRSTSQPHVFYKAGGLLADVHKADQFILPDGSDAYPDNRRRFSIADGPRHIGFGITKAELVETAYPTAVEATPSPFVENENVI